MMQTDYKGYTLNQKCASQSNDLITSHILLVKKCNSTEQAQHARQCHCSNAEVRMQQP